MLHARCKSRHNEDASSILCKHLEYVEPIGKRDVIVHHVADALECAKRC